MQYYWILDVNILWALNSQSQLPVFNMCVHFQTQTKEISIDLVMVKRKVTKMEDGSECE